MKTKVICCLAMVIMLLGSSGCVHEASEGSTRVFTYEVWVSLAVFLGGVLAVPAGWYLRKVWARLGWACVIMGPVVGLVLAPSLYLDRAILNETSFSTRGGIWGITARNEVDLDNLSQVRIVAEETRGRRGAKRINYFLLCELKDGSLTKIGISNDVREAATPYFLDAVAERGIPIHNET